MNRKNAYAALASLVFVLLSWNVFAITDEEIFRNFQFSFQNPGARSGAMGGAFIGLADDATAAEANPAGLTILTKPEVSFEYRNTQYDPTVLNQNSGFLVGETQLISANNIDDTNQLSFLSVVFPSDRLTIGVSRQEVLNIKGNIDETLRLLVPTPTGPVIIDFPSFASVDEKVVNWNFSLAKKFSDSFSIGASLRYSQLDWKSSVENFIALGTVQQPFFATSINDSDNAFAYNVGALWRFGQHVSLGAVYKRNPKFKVQGVETGDFAQKPGPFTNVVKIPDVYGVGFAIKPNDNMTISMDYQRVKYSDLTDGLLAGYNKLTDLLTNADITYKIDDENEFHIGTEFVVFLKGVPVALRQGYYHRPSNSLLVASLDPRFNDSRDFLNIAFSARDDENHFTFGAGAVFGDHFQLDWAIDVANPSDSFILSSVVRF